MRAGRLTGLRNNHGRDVRDFSTVFCGWCVERNSGRIRRVNYGTTTLAILVALSALFALAEDFETVQGKEYKNARVAAAECEDAGRFIARR